MYVHFRDITCFFTGNNIVAQWFRSKLSILANKKIKPLPVCTETRKLYPIQFYYYYRGQTVIYVLFLLFNDKEVNYINRFYKKLNFV